MKNKLRFSAVLLAGCSYALADDLTGSDLFLCAPGYVTYCSSDGACETAPPQNYDIPNFFRVDLVRAMLRSTEASEEDLGTEIGTVIREDGEIYLQGLEGGRAFSVVIDEVTGEGTYAIVANGESATGFLACTPQ